jgi:hypothetical protein
MEKWRVAWMLTRSMLVTSPRQQEGRRTVSVTYIGHLIPSSFVGCVTCCTLTSGLVEGTTKDKKTRDEEGAELGIHIRS